MNHTLELFLGLSLITTIIGLFGLIVFLWIWDKLDR